MYISSTLTVANGSSIDCNTAGRVSSPALSPLGSWLIHQFINRRSIAMKEGLRDDRARTRHCARLLARSQFGGGAHVDYYFTRTVANGSSIDGYTATVSLPAFALVSGLVVDSPIHPSTLD